MVWIAGCNKPTTGRLSVLLPFASLYVGVLMRQTTTTTSELENCWNVFQKEEPEMQENQSQKACEHEGREQNQAEENHMRTREDVNLLLPSTTSWGTGLAG